MVFSRAGYEINDDSSKIVTHRKFHSIFHAFHFSACINRCWCALFMMSVAAPHQPHCMTVRYLDESGKPIETVTAPWYDVEDVCGELLIQFRKDLTILEWSIGVVVCSY